MNLTMRIVDTGLRPARWNVAMTAALVELHVKGRIADTVRFHRYPASALLGRSQGMEAADVDYCQRAGIEIARRVTGGGAVFMSPRMLAWDVVIGRGGVASDLETTTHRVCEGVAFGLSCFGALARFRAPNDIEIGGRKVSGSSGYVERRSLVLQGTVLVADDVPDMARALRIPEAALRERVTCLAAVVGRAPPIADVVASIRDGLMQTLNRTPVMDQPSAEEMAAAECLLREDIGSEEFVTGTCAAQLAEDTA